MPLTLEDHIYFDYATNTAIIWGNDEKGRFRLTIPRTVLFDQFGFKGKYFDDTRAEIFIRARWSEFQQLAQTARDAGRSDLVLT